MNKIDIDEMRYILKYYAYPICKCKNTKMECLKCFSRLFLQRFDQLMAIMGFHMFCSILKIGLNYHNIDEKKMIEILNILYEKRTNSNNQ